MIDEPGLDNPAYVSTAEDGQPANSPLDSGRSNRTRGESKGWVSGNGLLAFLGIALYGILTVENSGNVFVREMVLVVLAATPCAILQSEMKPGVPQVSRTVYSDLVKVGEGRPDDLSLQPCQDLPCLLKKSAVTATLSPGGKLISKQATYISL